MFSILSFFEYCDKPTFNILILSLFPDETEYEYSGSEEEDEDPPEQEGEPRYKNII